MTNTNNPTEPAPRIETNKPWWEKVPEPPKDMRCTLVLEEDGTLRWEPLWEIPAVNFNAEYGVGAK